MKLGKYWSLFLQVIIPDRFTTCSTRIGIASFVISFALLTGNPIAGAVAQVNGYYTWYKPLVFASVSFRYLSSLVNPLNISQGRGASRGCLPCRLSIHSGEAQRHLQAIIAIHTRTLFTKELFTRHLSKPLTNPTVSYALRGPSVAITTITCTPFLYTHFYDGMRLDRVYIVYSGAETVCAFRYCIFCLTYMLISIRSVPSLPSGSVSQFFTHRYVCTFTEFQSLGLGTPAGGLRTHSLPTIKLESMMDNFPHHDTRCGKQYHVLLM
jgi:hypothetical protein